MKHRVNNKIKDIREKLQLSQERFGKKIGVSGKTISAYENGRASPSLKVLDTISDVYNVQFIKIKNKRKDVFFARIKRIRNSLNEIENILAQSIDI